jgi:hypothetical protein
VAGFLLFHAHRDRDSDQDIIICVDFARSLLGAAFAPLSTVAAIGIE